MKEPSSYFRHKRPQKLKLICSFNGAFQLRPHSGKVRYVGGETRIVSLDRKIGILQLVSKISQLCPSLPCFSIKYQLRNGSNGGEKDTPQPTPLVSVVTDEDVRFMIEEYDQLEADCKHARLWVFICANGYDEDSSAFSYVFWNSNFVGNRYLGNVDLSNGLQPNLNTTLVGKIGNCDDTTKKIESKSQNFAIHAAEIRNYDNPFEESVSTLQNPSGAHNFGDLILDYKAPNPHFNGNVAALSPTLDSQLHGSAIRGGNYGIYYQSGPMPQSNVLPVSSGLSVGNLIPSLGSQFHGLDGFSDGLVNGGENYGICNQSGPTPQPTSALPVSSDLSVNEVQRNLEHELMGNLNGENVRTYCDNEQIGSAPEFSHSQLLGRVSPVVVSSVTSNRNNLQGRFRNQRTSCEEVKNQRTSSYHMRSTTSYHMRNHRTNLAGIGNNNNNGTDGKVCPGKCYPGLKACSSILKHGQLMRSHYTHLWKSWTTAREGKGKMESTMSTQPSSPHKNYEGISDEQEMQNVDGRRPLDDIRTQGGLLAGEFERPNSSINYLDLQGLGLPSTITRNPFSSLEKLNMPEETFSSSNQVNCKSKAEPLVRNLSDAHNGCHSIPANDQSSDLVSKKETSSMGAQKNFCMEPDNKGAVKSSANDHNVVGTLSGVVTSLVNLSLHNLSLSSFEGASPSASSSLTSNDVSKSLSMCEMGAQPSPPDIMDEGHFSSGPPIDKLSMDNFSSSIDCVSDMEKNISPSKGNQKSTPSSLRVHEKADTNGSDTSPKLLDRICNDLIKFYDHLATRELQTIKSSDLEDIKELGSGTYGTVFYGKWKGSDVAIKRLKPNCFTGSELEKDRLIADFWKEAHIIAQLHHPNVVSFYGVVTDGPVTNLATVTEYMVNGSLKQVLQRKDRTIDRRKRIILAMDAAFGMEYLHEKNIVHFDLKSHNFLVNMKDPQRPVCKIGDMGLSKVKQRTLVSGGVRGTIPWMAPELLTSKKTMVTEKVDVYSFGIVMWELLTGEEPYHDLRTEETIAGIIKGDLRPDVPSWCDPTWRSLMERCWSSDPALRPSFSEIARELRSMAATMNIK